jgi:RNA polymerase sigma-70 factor (ECF subfamily)
MAAILWRPKMDVATLERTRPGDGDAELLARMRAGLPDAFAQLMRSNNQRLYRLARGFLDNAAEAEEALQESYVRAFTHLDRFRGESSLATWLARIVLNEALGRLRRRRPMADLDGAEEAVAAGDAPAPTPEQEIARREIRRAIERAVDDLPPAFRSVFIMRAVEEMSIEETAACLGIPGDTVKTRFHRANKQLRRALSAQFGALVEGAFPFLGPRCDGLVAAVLDRLGLV